MIQIRKKPAECIDSEDIILPRYVPPLDSKEKHYFGFNYCGPGTNVWRRRSMNVKPMDKLDAACLTHDIATEPRGPYTSKGDPKKLRAADRALRNSALKLSLDPRYPKTGAAASVATAMEFLLRTGARGRRIKK